MFGLVAGRATVACGSFPRVWRPREGVVMGIDAALVTVLKLLMDLFVHLECRRGMGRGTLDARTSGRRSRLPFPLA